MEKENAKMKVPEWHAECLEWYDKGFDRGWDGALSWLCRIPLNRAIRQLELQLELQRKREEEARP